MEAVGNILVVPSCRRLACGMSRHGHCCLLFVGAALRPPCRLPHPPTLRCICAHKQLPHSLVQGQLGVDKYLMHTTLLQQLLRLKQQVCVYSFDFGTTTTAYIKVGPRIVVQVVYVAVVVVVVELWGWGAGEWLRGGGL